MTGSYSGTSLGANRLEDNELFDNGPDNRDRSCSQNEENTYQLKFSLAVDGISESAETAQFGSVGEKAQMFGGHVEGGLAIQRFLAETAQSQQVRYEVPLPYWL